MVISQLFIATRNRDKIAEITDLLQILDIEIFSINDFPDLPPIEEDQDTLFGNAVKKASEYARFSKMASLADDTGLEVDALHGAPGVYSSRYAGPDASYEENVARLLSELATTPDDSRGAQFRTVMALALDNDVRTVEGCCRGVITRERRGHGGFGYDPIFYYPPLLKTFAELTLAEKNRISHRAIALTKMIDLIKTINGA